MNYERASDDHLGPDSQGITFVASTFAVVSFLCVLDAVSKKYCRLAVTRHPLRGHSLQITLLVGQPLLN